MKRISSHSPNIVANEEKTYALTRPGIAGLLEVNFQTIGHTLREEKTDLRNPALSGQETQLTELAKEVKGTRMKNWPEALPTTQLVGDF